MESAVSFEEIRDLFRQSRIEADRRAQEADRRAQETERRMRETERFIKEIGRQIGGLGNRLGEFVEGVVRPGLVRLFRERGIEVHQTLRDLEAKRDGEAAQIDLLVVNADHAVVVEVKSKLETGDVDEHLERIAKFKRLFPQYRATRLLGAIAAMAIPDDAARHAERCGLYVIGQAGDDAVFLNSPGFEPRAW